MKLNQKELNKTGQWIEKGYMIPGYNRAEMIERTKKDPWWIHFGAGNIFRAFQANVVERLLNEGILDRGLIVTAGSEQIEKLFAPHDNCFVLVTLRADGRMEKKVIGSVAEILTTDEGADQDFARMKEIFRSPSLQMASFTITEKGYAIWEPNGELLPEIAEDMKNGPEMAQSFLGKVTALLVERCKAGAYPIAMVSMDNCSHNGDKLADAVLSIADAWFEKGLVGQDFAEYLSNPLKVSFPWTMIDKITPRPDRQVQELLRRDEIEGMDPVITGKHKTYAAPFVNAEESEYLVIEDNFPNGRPALEKGGFLFTDKMTVDKAEKMKVCTCLNPLHTALAVFGCLLGFSKISDEMKDADLRALVERIGYQEGLPVATDPGIMNPKEFIDTVLNVRVPNPFIPDTPQRIAVDTSQKLSIRYGETIKAYLSDPDLDIASLKGIPLVLAAWLRYLMGVDDEGKAYELNADPLLDMLLPVIQTIEPGETDPQVLKEKLSDIISNASIFGVDLEKAGLADCVTGYLSGMMRGNGAVRETLHQVVTE
ncbi:MAG: mannitol dehydrogenase family protein [Blautia sp.]|nr:mannitol dehydrogenase family protein [Blautia sp.]